MAASPDEQELLRSVALQNANSILLARQRAEAALIQAKEDLEAKTRELAQSLSLLRATLEATNDAILVTDAEGVVLEFNEQFVKIWDLPPEVIDARQHDIIQEYNSRRVSDPAAFIARVNEIYLSGQEVFDELLLKDGRVFERFSKIQYLDGRAAGRVWSFRDITEPKRAEETRSRLAAVVESADDAIISKTLQGIITSWNGGAERTFGYMASETIGQPITILIPPDRLHEESEILAKLHRGERIEHYHTERVRKDGVRISVSLSVSPIRDGNGKVIGASKIARDITEQIRQARALSESEERLRAVIEATPECVKIVATDGSLEFMNSAGLCMIECESEQQVRGKSVFDLIILDHREAYIENHRRVCAGEKLDWQFQIIGLAGTRRWMETHAVPLMRPDGKLAQLSVTRDITTRKNADEEREQLLNSERAARTHAEHASRLKDEFLATLSHELRTPLSAILGWSQLLTLNPSETDLHEGLDAIQRNARAQTQLIEDLLDMSRIISGKVRLDVQRTDLGAVIDAAVDTVRPSADAKGIRLRKIIDPQAGPVSADPTRLQQVIWNLLSNAIKFTPKGGMVDVLLERVNSHLEITVHDSGMGISAEFLPVVFERFRQADASTTRSFGGLGLGLSIVKHLIELHGGTIRAKSAGEGKGATFIVLLPLAPLRSGDKREHPTSSKAPALDCQDLNLKGVKVLLVDDAPDARTLISRLLTQCQAEVRAADNADQGLRILAEFRPHILISDIGMPGKDGYQFIREVRELGSGNGGNVPAIALTAFARSEDRTRAMIAGYQVHVAKPIEPQELLATVGSLAGRTGKRA